MFVFQKLEDLGLIYWPTVPNNRIERADLSANHATIVESGRPIYRPTMPIRQDFFGRFNRSQLVKVNGLRKETAVIQLDGIIIFIIII